MQDHRSATIGKKAFLTSVLILLGLMLLTGLMSQFVPSGSYDRIMQEGREVVQPESFHLVDSVKLPVWRWFTAPLEVLWSDGNVLIISIILFLLFIGGAIAVLDRSQVLNTILAAVVTRFRGKKYLLMAILVLLFMCMGAIIGMFEEVVPLIPIFVALSLKLGWDSLTGLGIVLLSTGFGFAAAISNPFTIGVAQGIAGLPMFSGLFFRVIVFMIIYVLLIFFLRSYAKRIEKNPSLSPVFQLDEVERRTENRTALQSGGDRAMRHAVIWFAASMVLMLCLLVAGSFVPFLSSISLPLVGILFFIGGFGAGLLSDLGFKKTLRSFLDGCLSIAPAIVLILMASSIRLIVSNAGILDTILHSIAGLLQGSSAFTAVIIVYVLVLFMELFIGSGSAKAFLIMPLIVPLADIIGVNRQVMVLAFQFGDGFSNLLYPTNPVLLIGLGLTVVSYTRWFKWVFKLQAIVFAVTLVLLELALITNYGPF